MIDHAQAKINLINAACDVEKFVTDEDVSQSSEIARVVIKKLCKAAADYKETKQPKRVDEEGDDFDDFHGTG